MSTTSTMPLVAKEFETSDMLSVTKESGTSLMMNITKAAGALALYLGMLSWQGIIQSSIPFQIISGSILGLMIMVMGVQAARAGLPIWIVALALAWGVSFSLFSVSQMNILPDNQSITQVLHLVGGLGAIGISERLANEIEKITE